MKEIKAKLDGFTPLYDLLIEKYGVVTAAVYGKVWRFEQMKNGVCNAGQARIANELGLTRQTINKHIDTLVQDGYLKDVTPDLLGAPHSYATTGKINLSVNFTATEQPVNEIDRGCKANIQGGVNEIDTKILLRNKEELSTGANKKVDYILQTERKTVSKAHTALPEQHQPYAKAFADATGIKMTKREGTDWLATIQDWIDAGYQPHDITRAVENIKQEGRTAISRPGSITWKLRTQGAYKSKADERLW